MSLKLDHRQLADEMEIYFLNEEIGAGLPVWLPNGVALREALENFVKKLEEREGYQRVVSPHIGKKELYECSGHLRAFGENMYPPMKVDEHNAYYLRPMNCPHHHKVFSAKLRSYRHLPLRLAEYGQVYRFENSGSLKGLSRVRGLCQNDAHIYLAEQDLKMEIERVLRLHEECYAVLGLKSHRYRLSKHAEDQRFDGERSLWVRSECVLREVLQDMKLPFFEAEGEAAFYGPKIDVQMPFGEQGQEESVASVQVDFNSAPKFGLEYVDAHGQKQCPWIVHRAPLGSHERFAALLLEHFQGQFPFWLSPIQIFLIPVSDQELEYSEKIAQELMGRNIRVQIDRSGGSLSKRIHFAHQLRPFAKMILGAKERASNQGKLQLRGRELKVNLLELEGLSGILKEEDF